MIWSKIEQDLPQRFNGNVLLAQDHKILLQQAYGESNITTKKPLHNTTLFNLASVSKPITALATLLLIQNYNVSLQTNIQNIFPDFPYSNITIENLLQHTAGLPDYMALVATHNTKEYVTNQDIYTLLITHQPDRLFQSNENMAYSNTGYVLLALIIEHVSNMSFEHFLQQFIFQPLQMHNTIVGSPHILKERGDIAQPYIYDIYQGAHISPEQFKETQPLMCMNFLHGDGNIYASTTDLHKLGLAILHNTLWDKDLLRKALTPSEQSRQNGMGYGYGFIISEDEVLGQCIWHNGGWPGVNTTFKIYPQHQLIFVYLRNKEQNLDYDLALGEAIEHAYCTQSFNPPQKPKLEKAILLPVSQLQLYTGTYQVDEHPEHAIDVFIDDETHLTISLPATMPLQLHARSLDTFFVRGIGVTITFVNNMLTITQSDAVNTATKISPTQ